MKCTPSNIYIVNYVKTCPGTHFRVVVYPISASVRKGVSGTFFVYCNKSGGLRWDEDVAV